MKIPTQQNNQSLTTNTTTLIEEQLRLLFYYKRLVIHSDEYYPDFVSAYGSVFSIIVPRLSNEDAEKIQKILDAFHERLLIILSEKRRGVETTLFQQDLKNNETAMRILMRAINDCRLLYPYEFYTQNKNEVVEKMMKSGRGSL